MSFELAIEPQDGVVFAGPAGAPAQAAIQMGNGLGRRVAFKVKCTDNNLFKIEPATGLLNPEEGAMVTVTLASGAPVDGQSLAVSYIDAPDEPDAKAAWAKASGAEPSKTLAASFVPQ